jgi:hypothetical protein
MGGGGRIVGLGSGRREFGEVGIGFGCECDVGLEIVMINVH